MLTQPIEQQGSPQRGTRSIVAPIIRNIPLAATVNGSSLEDLIAEGGDYAKYADYVSDGYYHESELASAPSFDIIIDGITSQAN